MKRSTSPEQQIPEAQRPFDLSVILLSSVLKEVTENHRTHIPGLLPRRGRQFRNTYGVAAKVVLTTLDNERIPVVVRTSKSETDEYPNGTKTASTLLPTRPFALQRGLYLPDEHAGADKRNVHIASSSKEIQTLFNQKEINPRDAAETILTALLGFGYSFSPNLLLHAEDIGVLPLLDGSYVIMDEPDEPMTIPTKPVIQLAPRQHNDTQVGAFQDALGNLRIRSINLDDTADFGVQPTAVAEMTPQELEAQQVQAALPDLIERFNKRLDALKAQKLPGGVREAKADEVTLQERIYPTDIYEDKPRRNLVIKGESTDHETVQILISDPGDHQDRSPHISVHIIDQQNNSSVDGIDTLATLAFANKLI